MAFQFLHQSTDPNRNLGFLGAAPHHAGFLTMHPSVQKQFLSDAKSRKENVDIKKFDASPLSKDAISSKKPKQHSVHFLAKSADTFYNSDHARI
jgi:hypothetical protein